MISTLSPSIPMPGRDGSLEALTALLALVTQPAEAQAYLGEIAKASLDLDQKRTETQDSVNALKAEYDELKIRMARDADQHARKLASNQAKCDASCNNSMDEVRRIREGIISEQQLLGADRQRAAELKNKWEAKMRMIDEALKI
jgi:hypothetical protein